MLEKSQSLAPLSPQVESFSRVDRAWNIVAGAGLLMFINLGPVLYYTAGVFTKAITDDVGWPRGTIASVALPANLLTTVMYPLVGWAVEIFGSRIVSLVSSISFGMALAALGHFSSTPAEFAILLFLANAAAFGLTPLPSAQIVSAWFDRRRGVASSLMLTLGAVGLGFFPPFSAALIGRFCWRNAYVALGAMVLGIGVISSLVLLRNPPMFSMQNDAIENEGSRDYVVSAIVSRKFWILAAAFLSISFSIGGGSICLPLVLTDSGLTPQRAAFVMSVMGVSMILGRLLLGRFLDRVFAPRLTSLVFMAPALAFLCLVSSIPVLFSTIVAAALLGFGLGAEVDALAYIVSRAFGIRHFGKIFGFLMMAFSLGLAIGPVVFGRIFDYFHSYHIAMYCGAAAAIFASLILFLLNKSDLPFVGEREK